MPLIFAAANLSEILPLKKVACGAKVSSPLSRSLNREAVAAFCSFDFAVAKPAFCFGGAEVVATKPHGIAAAKVHFATP